MAKLCSKTRKIDAILTWHRIHSVCLLPVFVAATLGFTFRIFALQHHGRMTVGSYTSLEKHSVPSDGSDRNDFATASTRLFWQASNIFRRTDLTVDLRDKYDFFDNLNRNDRSLTAENTLQVYQVKVDYALSRRTQSALGRFFVPESGSAFVDGGQIKYRLTRDWSLGVFGGANPRRPDQSYVQTNSDSEIVGVFFAIQPPPRGWDRYFYSSWAFVNQSTKGETDRRYIYNQTAYQISKDSRLNLMAYLDQDDSGKTKLQNGLISWNESWTRRFETTLAASLYDVINYRRQQDIRESLEPSPYREYRLRAHYRWTRSIVPLFQYSRGARDQDGLSYTETRVKIAFPRFLSRRIDGSLFFGQRTKFTYRGPFSGVHVGYFTRTWELAAEVEMSKESHDDGTTLSPLLLELSGAYRYSRKVFVAMVVQKAQDENVDIGSFFVKVGYRFGNKELAPLRDGAAPRGRL